MFNKTLLFGIVFAVAVVYGLQTPEKVTLKSDYLVVPGQVWINTDCAAWNASTEVTFYSQRPTGNDILIFNSSVSGEKIREEWQSYFRVNKNKTGLEVNVNMPNNIPKPIYCRVNKTRSNSVQVNRITTLPYIIPQATNAFNGFYLGCSFRMVPKMQYSLKVDFFRDDVLFATFTDISNSEMIQTGLLIENHFSDIMVSGKFNPDYNLTITTVGQVVPHNYHCVVRNGDMASNNFTTPKALVR